MLYRHVECLKRPYSRYPYLEAVEKEYDKVLKERQLRALTLKELLVRKVCKRLKKLLPQPAAYVLGLHDRRKYVEELLLQEEKLV